MFRNHHMLIEKICSISVNLRSTVKKIANLHCMQFNFAKKKMLIVTSANKKNILQFLR